MGLNELLDNLIQNLNEINGKPLEYKDISSEATYADNVVQGLWNITYISKKIMANPLRALLKYSEIKSILDSFDSETAVPSIQDKKTYQAGLALHSFVAAILKDTKILPNIYKEQIIRFFQRRRTILEARLLNYLIVQQDDEYQETLSVLSAHAMILNSDKAIVYSVVDLNADRIEGLIEKANNVINIFTPILQNIDQFIAQWEKEKLRYNKIPESFINWLENYQQFRSKIVKLLDDAKLQIKQLNDPEFIGYVNTIISETKQTNIPIPQNLTITPSKSNNIKDRLAEDISSYDRLNDEIKSIYNQVEQQNASITAKIEEIKKEVPNREPYFNEAANGIILTLNDAILANKQKMKSLDEQSTLAKIEQNRLSNALASQKAMENQEETLQRDEQKVRLAFAQVKRAKTAYIDQMALYDNLEQTVFNPIVNHIREELDPKIKTIESLENSIKERKQFLQASKQKLLRFRQIIFDSNNPDAFQAIDKHELFTALESNQATNEFIDTLYEKKDVSLWTSIQQTVQGFLAFARSTVNSKDLILNYITTKLQLIDDELIDNSSTPTNNGHLLGEQTLWDLRHKISQLPVKTALVQEKHDQLSVWETAKTEPDRAVNIAQFKVQFAEIKHKQTLLTHDTHKLKFTINNEHIALEKQLQQIAKQAELSQAKQDSVQAKNSLDIKTKKLTENYQHVKRDSDIQHQRLFTAPSSQISLEADVSDMNEAIIQLDGEFNQSSIDISQCEQSISYLKSPLDIMQNLLNLQEEVELNIKAVSDLTLANLTKASKLISDQKAVVENQATTDSPAIADKLQQINNLMASLESHYANKALALIEQQANEILAKEDSLCTYEERKRFSNEIHLTLQQIHYFTEQLKQNKYSVSNSQKNDILDKINQLAVLEKFYSDYNKKEKSKPAHRSRDEFFKTVQQTDADQQETLYGELVNNREKQLRDIRQYFFGPDQSLKTGLFYSELPSPNFWLFDVLSQFASLTLGWLGYKSTDTQLTEYNTLIDGLEKALDDCISHPERENDGLSRILDARHLIKNNDILTQKEDFFEKFIEEIADVNQELPVPTSLM